MVPPSQTLNLDIEAISGICGSISLACWIVVFSPQIIENFRRGSADGLSVRFIVVWAAGDVFNVLGAILQGVLPTMIILAIYYLLADIVLLGQCFYYRGFTWHDDPNPLPKPTIVTNVGEPSEASRLLHPHAEHHSSISGSHLSPAVPLLDASSPAPANAKPTTRLQAVLFNLVAILMVCIAGIFGWWLSERSSANHHPASRDQKHDSEVQFSLWGQIFGYLCAALYLGSRAPQLLLNYRRKSTEGISMLFFLFACIGNLTYVLSIFAYEAHCEGKHGECRRGEAASLYGRYIAVNASWLAGSLGTLFLDLGIFVQFFLYREREVEGSGNGRVENGGERPLLDRGDSGYQ
ncbi:putative vacuolar amino acid transporter YPQ3 [Lachnellula cervina]|uniref:Putative vacuolar amino acid transporter YPQ3 n=1 Tax=Lachnellula cervina TaxID=1316786 RepID=A0A7D8USR3_9HELO|nr:putative vacuolar amino acid transporter YPQ3 [Lachnellula cervina]